MCYAWYVCRMYLESIRKFQNNWRRAKKDLKAWSSQWTCTEMPSRNYSIAMDWPGTIEPSTQCTTESGYCVNRGNPLALTLALFIEHW